MRNRRTLIALGLFLMAAPLFAESDNSAPPPKPPHKRHAKNRSANGPCHKIHQACQKSGGGGTCVDDVLAGRKSLDEINTGREEKRRVQDSDVQSCNEKRQKRQARKQQRKEQREQQTPQ